MKEHLNAWPLKSCLDFDSISSSFFRSSVFSSDAKFRARDLASTVTKEKVFFSSETRGENSVNGLSHIYCIIMGFANIACFQNSVAKCNLRVNEVDVKQKSFVDLKFVQMKYNHLAVFP